MSVTGADEPLLLSAEEHTQGHSSPTADDTRYPAGKFIISPWRTAPQLALSSENHPDHGLESCHS
jgi:hypothetical protein